MKNLGQILVFPSLTGYVSLYLREATAIVTLESYTKHDIKYDQFWLSCSTLSRCKLRYSVTNTSMLTQQYLPFFVNFLGDYRITLLQLLSFTKWFFIQVSITHDDSSSQVVDKRR